MRSEARRTAPYRSGAAPSRTAGTDRELREPPGGLFVGEFGCIEQTEGYSAGDPMAKADWFQGAADTVRAWGNVEAMCYSHAEATFQGHVMPYWIDSSEPSLASFSDVGRSNYFLTAL
jgi:hypothetical protein